MAHAGLPKGPEDPSPYLKSDLLLFDEYHPLRRHWKLSLVLIALLAALIWAAITLLRPLPARTVTMGAGQPGSALHVAAEHYRTILAHHGVKLILVDTAGAIENLNLLKTAHGKVDVAIIESGTTTEEQSPGIESLGTVFYEPLWVFCRCAPKGIGVADLPGTRLEIGPEGSATRVIAKKFLALNERDQGDVQLLGSSYAEAADKLVRGEVDGVFIMTGWDSPVVQNLLKNPDIGLISFSRADAYVALLPFLTKLRVPAGIADLSRNLPPHDVTLLAPEAVLGVRSTLHPALQYLLLEAASQVHSGPNVFSRGGNFPSERTYDLPLSPEAERFYKSGPSILQRYLPFWLAELVQRLLIGLLPLVGLAYPLWSTLPKAFYWYGQRQLYRIYGELKFIEDRLTRAPAEERALLLARLDVLDHLAASQSLPQRLFEMRYTLRNNIGFIKSRYGARV